MNAHLHVAKCISHMLHQNHILLSFVNLLRWCTYVYQHTYVTVTPHCCAIRVEGSEFKIDEVDSMKKKMHEKDSRK